MPTFTKGRYVFIIKKQLRAILDITADAIAEQEYKELQLRATEPFRMINV